MKPTSYLWKGFLRSQQGSTLKRIATPLHPILRHEQEIPIALAKTFPPY